MKERPILFSGEMVRALLDGRKTQTRRVVKMPPSWDCIVYADWGKGWWPFRSDDGESPNYDNNEIPMNCPYGKPGDRLWVRETHHVPGGYLNAGLVDEIRSGISTPDSLGVTYRADAPAMTPSDGGWTPSIHMPRWASRVLLEVTAVRVERLQEISDEDALFEGVSCEQEARAVGVPADEVRPRSAFRAAWERINGEGAWDDNPWVWVVEFNRIDQQAVESAA